MGVGVGACVRACVMHACMCACVGVCVCLFVCVGVGVCGYVRPSTVKASSVWIRWDTKEQISDVMLKTLISYTKFLHHTSEWRT